MRSKLLVPLGLVACCLPAAGRGADWPQFRGPNGSATSAETRLPAEWGPDKNVAWKTKLPGYGWSSPIVSGDKVFVTTAVSDKQRKPSGGFGGPGGFAGGPGGPGGGGPGGFPGFGQPGQLLPPFLQEHLNLSADQKKQLEALQKKVDGKLDTILTDEQKKQLKEMRPGPGRGGPGGFGGFGGMQRPPDAVYRWEVCCLDAATGKVLWSQVAREGKPRVATQASNTYASETPVTDGERVYAYFGMHGVYCYDFAGRLVWKADLGSYPTAMGVGTGSSPALDDGRLFVQCDNEEKSFLVALDAKTGKELWRADRPERTGFSTPLVWKNQVRTEVVCVGSPRVRSYDPATGKQLWELGGMAGQAKATPAADAEHLYVGTGGGPGGFGGPGGRGGGFGGGGGRPLFAVKAGASGDLTPKAGEKTTEGIAWHLPQAGPQTASPLLYDGHLYVLDEHGGLLTCYDAATGKQAYRQRLPGAAGFTASPWAGAGKVFCLADDGETFVVRAGPEFQLLGQNKIDEQCWSSPAAAGGALFVRTVDRLYCIKDKEKAQ
jgi:outer membrane protein assembly factor BamB